MPEYKPWYRKVERRIVDLLLPFKPQELIAFSGHDGRDAVYFELRHRGAPVDPAGWLAPR